MFRSRYARRLRVWHRRLGVASCLVLLLVALTGLLLNHTSDLHLSSQSVRWGWLHQLYGVDQSSEWVAYRYEDGFAAQAEDGTLYLNQMPAVSCSSDLLGVGIQEELQATLIVCRSEWLLLASDGSLLERIGVTELGLPASPQRAGECDLSVCVESEGGSVWRADVVDYDAQAYSGDVSWWNAHPLTSSQQSALNRLLAGRHLSWERVVLDLHSGRIAGSVGVWIVDLAAVVLIFLCGSGLWMWWRSRPLRQSKR